MFARFCIVPVFILAGCANQPSSTVTTSTNAVAAVAPTIPAPSSSGVINAPPAAATSTSPPLSIRDASTTKGTPAPHSYKDSPGYGAYSQAAFGNMCFISTENLKADDVKAYDAIGARYYDPKTDHIWGDVDIGPRPKTLPIPCTETGEDSLRKMLEQQH